MKPILLAASILTLLPTLAFATDLAAANANIDKTLRSLGDANTSVALVVDEAVSSGSVINHVKAHATYRKGTGVVTVDSMTYDNNAGSPVVHTVAHIDTDFSRMLPANEWRMLAPNMESLLNIAARSWARSFGNAVMYKVRVSKLTKDQTGTYNSFHVDASFNVNMKLLPPGVNADSIATQSATIAVDVDLKQGMKLDVTARPNIESSTFGANEKSLPELLDKLAAGDPAALAELVSFYKYIDARLGPLSAGQLPNL